MTRLLVSVGIALITTLPACQLGGVEPVAARGQYRVDAPVTAEYVVVGATPEPEAADVEIEGEELASPRAVAPNPIVTIEETEGVESREVQRAMDALNTRVAECMPNQSGIIRVRITREGDHTHIRLGTGTSLDPRTQRCVLETLSTMNYDETWSRSSPADKATGFSALFRIEF